MADEKKQIDKFREAARQLEMDDSEERFEAAVRKIAHAPKLSDEEIKALARKRRAQSKMPRAN